MNTAAEPGTDATSLLGQLGVRATAQGLAFNTGRILAAVGALQMGALMQTFHGRYAQAGAVITLVYAAGLVFSRIGAMVMLVPGLGDASVPPRIRLAFALLMSLLLTPLVAHNVTVPPTVGEGAGALIRAAGRLRGFFM